jgi:hypothetical protein
MAAPASAVDEISLHVGRVSGAEWSSGDVQLTLGFAAEDRISATLTSVGLSLPEPFHTLDAITVNCPRAEATATAIQCANAELRLAGSQGEATSVPLAMHLDRSSGHWRLRLRTTGLDPGPAWDFAAKQGWLPAVEISAGEMSLSLQFSAGSPEPALQMDAALSGVDFSDAAGLHAGEKLDARLRGHFSGADGHWQSAAELKVDAGQMYLHPVYLDTDTAPLSLSLAGSVDAGSGALQLVRVQFHQSGVASVDGKLTIGRAGQLQMLDLQLSPTALAPIYRTYLQPFVVGTPLDALRIEGRIGARLQWPVPGGDRRLQLTFDDADIEDGGGRFSVFGIGGQVDWHSSGGTENTTLTWEGGQFYRIDFGAGTLGGRFVERRFDLAAPLRVPLLEGALRVNTLEVAAIGTPELAWNFRGALEPMSLQALTRSLAWPPFGGTLAGDIPLVSYSGGTITVDGSLDLEVFDGAVRLRRLSIDDPFGGIPVLRADVDLQNLSLDALTSTFSFGNIQGKLQGRVHGLMLTDWKPTTFDARFATPDDDDSRHRISQRAVENLASLGGAGAVLSSTFLRVFEEFSYRRLGISCRLQNGVCEMGGVAPADDGYYIVEGGGLPPRIDVLGFNRRVDWKLLLSRFELIATTEGPVIR